MDYTFVATKNFKSLFLDNEENNQTFGDMIRMLTQESVSGFKIENRERFLELTDKDWNEIIQKAHELEKRINKD